MPISAVTSMPVDRKTLIGKVLRTARYRVSIEDVQDFVGVMPKSSEATEEAPEVAPPTFAPLVAVLGLLRTFDWSTDFQFDYRDGTAMFGEQFIDFHRPLYVDEEVEINAVINDVYEKSGRQKFDVVQLAFEIKGDRDGQLVMTGKQSYILFK